MSTENEALINTSDSQVVYGSSGGSSSASTGSNYTKTKAKGKYRVDNFLPCDPRRWMHRYLMLCLMCSLSFGKETEIIYIIFVQLHYFYCVHYYYYYLDIDCLVGRVLWVWLSCMVFFLSE